MTQGPRMVGRLAESRLDLPGTTNLRDLAGYPAGSGQVIGAGRLLRGEVLALPGGNELQGVWDPANAQPFRDLGLRTIIDLRAEREVLRTPSAWQRTTGAELIELPIAEGGEGADTDFVRMLLSGELARFDESHMTDFYRSTLSSRAHTFAAAVRILAEADRLPALVHCSAGKDRTGLLIALVLDALGTPRELVLEDYALTGVLRPNRIAAYAHLFTEAGVDPETGRVLFESPAASMSEVLAWLDETYGGAGGYLITAGDLDEDVLDSLRRAMLVSNSGAWTD